MEIVHDRERERYSKHISRTFTKGIYYLQVNANHPSYILRTRVLPVPPYDDPRQAVEAGMHYIMNVGDAWFAQVPREGNIYARADNLHDTATRCTACHPSSFSTEANLTAHRFGYPIRSKDKFSVCDRPTLQLDHPPLRRRRPLLAALHRDPAPVAGQAGAVSCSTSSARCRASRPRTFQRFGPFLRDAWAGASELPADEVNGVVPLDSKFGFAWRDWRVPRRDGPPRRRTGLPRCRRRTSPRSARRPAADTQIETLQDRIHRLYAWWLDRHRDACQPDQATRPVRCWPFRTRTAAGMRSTPGPARARSTRRGRSSGRLLEVGLHARTTRAIAKGLDYLLATAATLRRLVPDDDA